LSMRRGGPLRRTDARELGEEPSTRFSPSVLGGEGELEATPGRAARPCIRLLWRCGRQMIVEDQAAIAVVAGADRGVGVDQLEKSIELAAAVARSLDQGMDFAGRGDEIDPGQQG